jgi:hypothetical protein
MKLEAESFIMQQIFVFFADMNCSGFCDLLLLQTLVLELCQILFHMSFYFFLLYFAVVPDQITEEEAEDGSNEEKAEEIDTFGFDGLGETEEDYAAGKVVALAQSGDGAVLFVRSAIFVSILCFVHFFLSLSLGFIFFSSIVWFSVIVVTEVSLQFCRSCMLSVHKGLCMDWDSAGRRLKCLC